MYFVWEGDRIWTVSPVLCTSSKITVPLVFGLEERIVRFIWPLSAVFGIRSIAFLSIKCPSLRKHLRLALNILKSFIPATGRLACRDLKCHRDINHLSARTVRNPSESTGHFNASLRHVRSKLHGISTNATELVPHQYIYLHMPNYNNYT